MCYTVKKHDERLIARGKHSVENTSRSDVRLTLLHQLLFDTEVMWQKTIKHAFVPI